MVEKVNVSLENMFVSNRFPYLIGLDAGTADRVPVETPTVRLMKISIDLEFRSCVVESSVTFSAIGKDESRNGSSRAAR